ncbi:MAG: VTT domain-containing protein [Deltaproteobacteria bacterium]|nr:VTT domain-containing protein [Deltaproteobacteria bacterium]
MWVIHLIRDPGDLIRWGGYPGLTAIVYLETGAMVFFLPGDSLLVTAGIYAAKGDLNIWILNLLLIPAAIIGDATSYWIGAKSGPRIFNKPRSRFFRPEHVKAAHDFYEKHGGKAIIISRFMPLVRTFVPVVAGVAKMPYRQFAIYNITGAALWVLSMTMLGYILGRQFEHFVTHHTEKIIIAVVLLSISPGIYEYVKLKLKARKAAAAGEVPAGSSPTPAAPAAPDAGQPPSSDG